MKTKIIRKNALKVSKKMFLSLLTITVILSCGKEEEKPKDSKEVFATAQVAIGNDIDFDFNGDIAVGVTGFETKLGLGFMDSKQGNYLYLAVQAPNGLKEGTYSLQIKEAIEDGVTAYLTLNPDDGLFPKNFDTKTDLDGDTWNDGTGNITITSLKGHWVEGTFSAVAYSKSGDEVRVTDGKFKAEVKYEF